MVKFSDGPNFTSFLVIQIARKEAHLFILLCSKVSKEGVVLTYRHSIYNDEE